MALLKPMFATIKFGDPVGGMVLRRMNAPCVGLSTGLWRPLAKGPKCFPSSRTGPLPRAPWRALRFLIERDLSRASALQPDVLRARMIKNQGLHQRKQSPKGVCRVEARHGHPSET